ncbi:ATP-binding cassette domain-containing protein [Periweissella fabaria]|uniref:Iron export ATP-binding protein FetA n=1 Tax=Periweissella fabaria TaxID=546157 RepID=A0ABM8Z3X3_9LACO|nr:ATP-binding cassette domain-containing protein [Periweissella fabaria]MCM0597451.1 ATP-binding cassette domain-containing protein [Periweissella fabaria]CAH0416044.1 putative iron export ATP-binding protein FetA [Periweissella fabaria]
MQFELKHVGIIREQKHILQDINLTIANGDYITVTGPSGSGKSTLVKALASLIDPDEGVLSYNGQDIMTLNPIEYRREVSYCVQQPILFGETVRDNFAFPYQIRKQAFDTAKVEAYLEQVQLDAHYLDQPIASLSGGERQRVALLRNVLFEPRVLLLDEVTTGLDTVNKTIIHNLIEQFNREQKITIVQITHDAEEIAMANRLLKVVDGRISDESGVI